MSDPYERESARAAMRTLQQTLIRVTKQRDILMSAMEKIASLDFVITLPDRMDAVRKIARQTIQIVKKNEL